MYYFEAVTPILTWFVDVLLRVPASGVFPGIGRNLILYNIYNRTGFVSGSQPILDSDHSEGSPRALNFKGLPGTSLMVQIIGCSLSTSAGLTIIDAATNQLLAGTSPMQGARAHSTWKDWEPDLEKATACVMALVLLHTKCILTFSISYRLEDMWATMFQPNVGSVSLWDDQPAPPTVSDLWSCVSYQTPYNYYEKSWGSSSLRDMYDICHIPTVIENYRTDSARHAIKSAHQAIF